MVLVVPTSLLAQDSSRAMLHSEGQTRLNGAAVPNSSAIFLHDVVQTSTGSTAKIEVGGSSVEVQPETIVQFEGNELVLEHGRLQLNTSRAMRVRVNCLAIIPLTQERTRYDVRDVDGKVTVAANEHDVQIHSVGGALRTSRQIGNADITVHPGEQVTREESCGAPSRPANAVSAAGAIMNNPWVIGTAAVAIGVPLCYALCRKFDDPLSPYKP
jgi:ferric-dicitrate binding protein FerR (iron transport regulator)